MTGPRGLGETGRVPRPQHSRRLSLIWALAIWALARLWIPAYAGMTVMYAKVSSLYGEEWLRREGWLRACAERGVGSRFRGNDGAPGVGGDGAGAPSAAFAAPLPYMGACDMGACAPLDSGLHRNDGMYAKVSSLYGEGWLRACAERGVGSLFAGMTGPRGVGGDGAAPRPQHFAAPLPLYGRLRYGRLRASGFRPTPE